MAYDSDVKPAEMPMPDVKIEGSQLRISLKTIAEEVLFDQSTGMVSGEGCVSNPRGPGC
jgi:hypothetical protein